MNKYIVFVCTKCSQFTYAKVTQKGKKCPRCGRYHELWEVEGKIVETLKEANLLVRDLQNEIASKNGGNPNLTPLILGFSIKKKIDKK